MLRWTLLYINRRTTEYLSPKVGRGRKNVAIISRSRAAPLQTLLNISEVAQQMNIMVKRKPLVSTEALYY
jgi:hypothetical protein